MESITGRRPFLAALRRGPRPSERAALAAGLIALALLLLADVSLGSSAAITGIYLVAPFIAAMFGAVRATLVLALLAVALGAASSGWNMNFGITAYWVRLGGLAAGGAFALAAAWALERSRLNARRLEVLDHIGAIADGSLPLDETMARVTELIVPIAADLCMLDVIHDGRVTRAAVRADGHPDAARVEERIRRRRPSLPRWMVEDVPQWRHLSRFLPRMREEDLRRMANDPDDLAFLRELAPRSSIAAPLLARGRSLGALTMVTAWSRRSYTTEDVHFAQILAGRVALALDNAGIFSDLESVERRMDAVMSLIDEAVAVHDAGGRLVFANLAAARWLGYETAQQLIDAPAEQVLSRYQLISEDGERLDGPDALRAELARGESAGRVALRVVLRDSGEERWAILASEAIRGPDGALLYTVTTVNDVTEVKRAEFAQRLLAGTGELLASSIDYRETLARVAMLAVPQFADWCAVNIPREDGMIEQVAVAHGEGARSGFAFQLSDRFPGRLGDGSDLAEVMSNGTPLLRPSGRLSQVPGPPRDRGSSLVVPMGGGAAVVGALAFVNDPGSRAFDEADLDLAAEIARRAGLAVANARLATEQADVARTLQRSLLPPRLPEIPGWSAAAMYRPAGQVTEVGGDFYDAFMYEDGWMLVVGDVVGRGARAASLTALARYTIRTAGTLTRDPSAALAKLNEAIRERSGSALCSAVVVALPGDGGSAISLVSAGHPPALVLRPDGIEELPIGGPMLGAVESPEFIPYEVEVQEGDQLVVYTDGVTEARGQRERFGEDRLRRRLTGTADPDSAVAGLEAALDAFSDGRGSDDAAAVVLQRRATRDLAAELERHAAAAR